MYVEGDVDAIRDMGSIQTELRLKDIEWVVDGLEKSGRSLGSNSLGDKEKEAVEEQAGAVRMLPTPATSVSSYISVLPISILAVAMSTVAVPGTTATTHDDHDDGDPTTTTPDDDVDQATTMSYLRMTTTP
ncbi:hypothetical protein BDZ89DRAFT_1147111 [Hymenopellis radicata]|nr:hypothetical protein BDZ89DRAFT_1147111 [Hymenopellis radicata]